MVDLAYTDASLAGLYDLINPWRPCDDFYLDLVMSASAVLDIGCGTGVVLHRAREAGHTGRLCGLDPAAGMLAQARRYPAIEWVLGDLASTGWDREFDLVVMTGHAFQELVGDDEIRTALAGIRAALTNGGRFAFETRNPLVRPWERWTPEHPTEVTTPAGAVIRVEHQVESVTGQVVRFTETFTSTGWDSPRVSRSSLRFLDVPELASFLPEAGLTIEEQFGDWSRAPLTGSSPEIITICRSGREKDRA